MLISRPAGVGRLIKEEGWFSTVSFLCPSAVLAMSEKEQQCHLPADTMAADDVWQMGCLFWQLLMRGEPAFCTKHTPRARIPSAVREAHNALVSFSCRTCLVRQGCFL